MRSIDATTTTSVAPPDAAPARPADERTLIGYLGMASGLLFLVMLVWEHAAGLQPGDTAYTAAQSVNQAGFTIALVGYVVLVLGLLRSGALGEGRGGRIAGTGLAAGFTALVLANLLTFLGVVVPESDPLLPVGGLLQTLAGLAVGVIVARAGAWRGWQRWWPLALSVYWLLAMFVPVFAGIEPTFPTEALWAVSYVVLGVAVLSDGGRRPTSAT